VERVLRPLPEWKWRTFPVYFAFSLGAFVGLYLGLIAAAGPAWLGTAVFITVAILLGLGLSRLTTRWLVTREWMRRREKRKAKT
jgi:glycerol-3-phosphate acyltransferase PlsY